MKLALTSALATLIVSALAATSAFAGSDPNPLPGDTLLGKVDGLAYVLDEEETVNPAFTDALAACPNAGGAWRLTGGGARSSSPIPDLVSSRPLDLATSLGDADGARDDYWEVGTGESVIGAELKGFAICSKMNGLRYSSEEFLDGPVSARSSTGTCPAGRIVTGGGGFVATTSSFLGSMYPAGGTWTTAGFDNIGGAGTMTVDYVCGRPRGIKVVKATGPVPASGTLTLKAKCRGGRHVIGGGIRYRGSAAFGHTSSSFPIDLGDADAIPDDAWRATLTNFGPANVGAITYAICKR